MCAFVQTLDARYSEVQELHNISLLSIGTGESLDYIKEKKHDWGMAQWASPLIRILMNGVEEIADYQCRWILGKKRITVSRSGSNLMKASPSIPLKRSPV